MTVWQAVIGFGLIVLIILFVFRISIAKVNVILPENFRELLNDYVRFYRQLNEEAQLKFEKRIEHFLSAIKIHPFEPEESPTLSTGYKVGSHRIQGISDEFIPAIVKLNEMDPVIKVSDGDSILMALKLARTLGLAVGISSGANLIGAIQLQQQTARPLNVVTIFCDSNKKYLSTDLMKTEPVKPGYLSPDIELLDDDAIHRM